MPDKVILYAGFVAISAVLLAVFWVVWQRRRLVEEPTSTAQRVAKNTVSPMAAQLVNKVIDMGFAILVLRLLGATRNGEYAFAVVVWWYFATVTDFGLGTLLTREVAKDRGRANVYLCNTILVRLVLCLASLPVVAGLILFYSNITTLTTETTLAIALLIASLIPGGISGALSSLFYAFERMEYPAFMTTATTVLRVALGVGVLLAGFGIVGLASVAIVVSTATAIAFYFLVRSLLFQPKLEFDVSFARRMVVTSFPLLLNNLLSSLFFKIDVFLLKPVQGDTVVGWYNAAYKFVDGLLIIPSTLTLALFPVLSNLGATSRESLLKTYVAAARVLLVVSLPIAVGTAYIAPAVIGLFAGPEFLPQSAIALQVLIWFLPFSYFNGITQYVLIAIDKQRFITMSFAITLVFNVAANLVLIPMFSYAGAAIVTIASEIVLLIPFYYCVRKYIGRLPVSGIALRPVLSVALMGVCLWWIRDWNPLLLVAIGGGVYIAALLALRTFSQEEMQMMRSTLPRLRRRPA